MSKYHIKCTEPDERPRKKVRKPPPPEPPEENELIASLSPNQPCCCEVVSRALQDDLPKILGMSNIRAALQAGPDTLLDCNPDIEFEDPGQSNTNKEGANSAKPPK